MTATIDRETRAAKLAQPGLEVVQWLLKDVGHMLFEAVPAHLGRSHSHAGPDVDPMPVRGQLLEHLMRVGPQAPVDRQQSVIDVEEDVQG